MFATVRITLAISLLFCVSLVGFAQVPGANDPDAKELAAYRLTIPTFNKVLQATKNMAEAAKNDPRFKRQAALEAEIEKLEEKDDLSEADEARLEKLRSEAEALDAKLFPDANTATLSEMAAGMEREPLIAKALAAADLTAREYAKFMFASLQAGLVAGMLQQGLIKEVPKDLAASMNMENVKFMQEHQAELEAFRKAMEALDTQ